jgi:TPR repeat protein
MKVITKLMIILGLLLVPFTVSADDAAAGLFGVQMKLALKGKPQDQYFLGVMYEEGLGAKANMESARMWFEKSAKQNYSLAIIKLKQLDNPKANAPEEDSQDVDNHYETNPVDKVKRKKVVRKKVSTSTKYSRQEKIAKREIEKKRKAWREAMRKQAQYAQDAFE